ncbi:MAG: folylpolyglutamate synthase/dihydrofolate synthase family protein [Planctomycetota bacterium]
MSLHLPDWPAAERYLGTITDYERMAKLGTGLKKVDLSRTLGLMAYLDHPERAVPAAHITGTKGKGSTAMLLATLTGSCGKVTGLYTSPHLEELQERIAIDGVPVPYPDLARLIDRQFPYLEEQRNAGSDAAPTFFEIMTACAADWFRERHVDLAVYEVGLGGRLDSTNVLSPEVTAITSVSLEHTHILGDTIEAIAREKGGIIKPGVPLVSGCEFGSKASLVLESIVKDVGASIWRLGREIAVRYRPAADGQGIRLDVETPLRTWNDLELNLLGRFQSRNVAVALAMLDHLEARDQVSIDTDAVRVALGRAHVPGRLENLGGEPPLILDGAHTPDSTRQLSRELDELFEGRRRVAVIAIARDKNIQEVIAGLLRGTAAAVLTTASSPRSATPEELFEGAGTLLPETVVLQADPGRAVEVARDLAGSDGVVVVSGSFYLVGEVRKRWRSFRMSS